MYCDVCGFGSLVSRDLPSSLTAALAHPGNAPFTLHCQQRIYTSGYSVFVVTNWPCAGRIFGHCLL